MKNFCIYWIKTGGLTLAFCCVFIANLQAQVLIGESGIPHSAAMLELRSSNRGFLPPRINLTSNTMWLSNVQPTDGMVIYSTNESTGKGLYSWYGSRWNSLIQKSSTPITYAKFKGTGLDGQKNRLTWEPVYTYQPAGATPMWYNTSATDIVIRAAGIYLVSASFRIENTNYAHAIKLWNNTSLLGTRSYKTSGTQNKSLSITIVAWFNENDVLTVGESAGGKSIALGLGTTELSVTQIPLNTF